MREWFVTKHQLDFADEMRAEARTREVTISTFPFQYTDQKLYVFTEEELKGEMRKVWMDCYAKYHSFATDGVDFESYWQQKFGGGE